MVNPQQCPQLANVADACMSGACNMSGIIRSFGKAVLESEVPPSEFREHPAIKVILGQLSYLCGESLGPTPEALDAYYNWCKITAPAVEMKEAA